MQSLIQDIAFAFRFLRRRSGATVIIVLTLALGLGINTTIFSSINGMVFAPLPFDAPEELVSVSEARPRLGDTWANAAAPNFLDWRQDSTSFSTLGAFARTSFNLDTRNQPQRVRGAAVTADLFPMLGITPVQGRLFNTQEDRPGGPRLALISHQLWHDRFAGDPRILGRTLLLNDRVYEVLGVMPEGMKFPDLAEVWTPLALDPTDDQRDRRDLHVIGRLGEGVTLEQAQAELGAIADRLATEYPETNAGWGVHLRTLHDAWMPPAAQLGALLQLGAVGFLLLIVCANVANLILTQAAGRRRETALRTALGASRRRLVRQGLTESGLLAAMGGILGLLFAAWGVEGLRAMVQIPIPYWISFDFELNVLLYCLALTLLTGFAIGLLPALRSSGGNVVEGLKSGGRAGLGGSQRLRSALVVAELALAVVLLVGALLMVKSVHRLEERDLGYRPEGVLTARLSLTGHDFDEDGRRGAYLLELRRRLEGLGEATGATVTTFLPASPSGWDQVPVIAEGQAPEPGEEPEVTLHGVTNGYFDTLGIPVRSGRDFTETEVRDARPVAVVSERLAAHLWPDENALGRQLRLVHDDEDAWLRVIGIVGDVEPAYQILGVDGAPDRQLYLPYGRSDSPLVTVALRTPGNPRHLAPPLRQIANGLGGSVPVFQVNTLERVLDLVNWVPRLWGQQFSLFAAIALLIAALGAYGVSAYSVSQRIRELGIRIAMGARPRDIRRLVLTQGLTLGLLGVVLGLAGALPLSRLLASLLFEISASDPMVFAAVALMLAVVATFATYLPARRAARVDPIRVLNSD